MKAWDLRKNAVVLAMAGHSDTITGMQISPDGSHLLTNAMVRPALDFFVIPLLCSRADCSPEVLI